MVHNLDSSDTNMALVPKIKGRISCIKPWQLASQGEARVWTPFTSKQLYVHGC